MLTLGLLAVISGLRRSRRRRRDRDRAIAGSRAENKRLAAQLEEQQAKTVGAQPAVRSVPAAVPTGLVSTGDVNAYPTEAYPAEPQPAGGDYVLDGGYGRREPDAADRPGG